MTEMKQKSKKDWWVDFVEQLSHIYLNFAFLFFLFFFFNLVMKRHYDREAWANARLERRCNSASRIYIYVVVQFSSCFELSRNSLLHVTFTFLCFVICWKQKRFRKKIEQQHTCIDALTEKKNLPIITSTEKEKNWTRLFTSILFGA